MESKVKNMSKNSLPAESQITYNYGKYKHAQIYR